MKFFATMLFFFFINFCSSQIPKLLTASVKPHYTLKITEANIRKIEVDATIPLTDDSLYMSQSGFAPLINGWATFVHDLKATDTKGNIINLAIIGKGVWKADIKMPATIHLKYNILIGHDTVQWKTSAAFARAYATDSILFIAGRPVFIAANGFDSAKIEVHFDLPKAWKVATPYYEVPKQANTFEANNLSDLWSNGNFIGHFVQQQIKAGKLKVIIAGTYTMSQGVELFKTALTKIIDTYTSLMGGSTKGKLVIMGSVAQLADGGEAFSRSISLMLRKAPDMSNKTRWAYLLSHEVFHLWNGDAIAPVNQSQVEWFLEGFTDYMAKLVAYKTGLINEQELFQQIAIGYYRYLNVAGKISMLGAGTEKGKNFGLLYYGGMTAAIALDIESRTSSKNKDGFIGIMSRMYKEFGATHKLYSYQDIVRISNDIAGKDLSKWFTDYVAGTNIIPLDKYLNYIGLQLTRSDGKTLIERKVTSSPHEHELLQAILDSSISGKLH